MSAGNYIGHKDDVINLGYYLWAVTSRRQTRRVRVRAGLTHDEHLGCIRLAI